MSKFKGLLAVTGIAVAVTIAAACGNGAEPASTSAGTAPPASVSAPQVGGDQRLAGQPILMAGGSQAGISVTGQGTISLEPDLAVLNVGVETTGNTVAEARSEAAEAMNAILAALRARDIEDRDIQTRFFNISPRYEFAEVVEEGIRTRRQVLIGYTVSNTVSTKIRDLEAVGSIIDEVAEAGGDMIRINGISFTVDDPKPFALELREAAVKDALDKAGHLASLAGVSLGRLVFITESTGGMPVVQEFAVRSLAAFADGGPTPISGGELELRMTIQAIFEIM